MTTFDDRENAFENKFAHDAEMQFRAEARRNKLLGLWAAELMGKTGDDAEAYAREVVKESYLSKGRPDLYNDDMIHYLTDDQFAYAAAVDGIMLRQKPAACFYQGKFYAESLILAETGNSIGASRRTPARAPRALWFSRVGRSCPASSVDRADADDGAHPAG